MTKWRTKTVTVLEPCIQAKDEPPAYPWNKIVFESCNGQHCIDDEEMRLFIWWRNMADGWMSTTKTKCSEKADEKDSTTEGGRD